MGYHPAGAVVPKTCGRFLAKHFVQKVGVRWVSGQILSATSKVEALTPPPVHPTRGQSALRHSAAPPLLPQLFLRGSAQLRLREPWPGSGLNTRGHLLRDKWVWVKILPGHGPQVPVLGVGYPFLTHQIKSKRFKGSGLIRISADRMAQRWSSWWACVVSAYQTQAGFRLRRSRYSASSRQNRFKTSM